MDLRRRTFGTLGMVALAASPAVPRWLKAAHAASYALCIVVNAGAALGWFGETNAEVSGKWPVPITPAGWAFSIWGLIFSLQGVGAVYTLLNVGYNRDSHEKEHAVLAGCWVQALWLSQDLWQVAFSNESFYIAFFLIASACAFGIFSVLRLHEARETFGAFSFVTSASIAVPTSINASWLLAATCVQLLITLKSGGMSEGDLSVVSVALVVMAALVAVGAVLALGDIAWGFTAVWALVAIAVNNKADQPAVYAACLTAVPLLAVCVAVSLVRRLARVRSPEGRAQFVRNPAVA